MNLHTPLAIQEITASRRDVSLRGLTVSNGAIWLDFNHKGNVYRLGFDGHIASRIVGNLMIAKLEGEIPGVVFEHFAYTVESSHFMLDCAEAFPESGSVLHYRCFAARECIDVLATSEPIVHVFSAVGGGKK